MDPPTVNDTAAPGGTGAAVRGRETTSGRISKLPEHLQKDYHIYVTVEGEEVVSCQIIADDGTEVIEPVTYEEAMRCKQAIDWKRALLAELASLQGYNTWDIVDLPPGVVPIPCKWVFKIKRNSTGLIERFKCRLVAKGFMQIFGVDYLEITAPVARLATVRALFALAAAHGWQIMHLDTDTAFLHGVLQEKIYMQQPPGFQLGGPNQVCLLNKCIYGLKQAPYVWHKTLKAAFAEQSFKISFADPSMWILVCNVTKAFAIIYVDDQIITGPNTELNNRVKRTILDKFPGKDLGEAEFYVGMKIERDFENKTLKLSQTRHIDDLIEKYGQAQARTVSVPMDKSLDLSPNASEPFPDVTKYISLSGSLQYLSMVTRPDIAYAASVLSRFNAKPTYHHWRAAIKVVRYLKATRTYGLVYGRTVGDEGLSMIGYVDSNYAGDKYDFLSTYGFAFKLNGAAVSWTSKKQGKVAHSTGDAEYVAASLASKEALWLRKLMADCDIKGPLTLYCDNTLAISLAKEPNYSATTKYLGVHHEAVLERARHGDVTFEYVQTGEMIADIFTKPLETIKFEKFRARLGVME